MFILFGVLESKLDYASDVVVGLVYWEFDSFSLFGSVLENLLIDFLVENDIDINGSSQSPEEARHFFLNNRTLTIFN